MKAISPCKGCDRRLVGCHSLCPDYKEFRAKIDEMHEANREEHPILSGKKKRFLYRKMLGR